MAHTENKHDLAALERLYSEAESVDQELFSEMRSNVLLVSGEHYNRKHSSFFKRIRDSKELTEQQKLRLTKNHVQNIHKKYVNNILSMAPGVGFAPANSLELQDQKTAELHHSVWLNAKERHELDEQYEDWAEDLMSIGECAVKIFYDTTAGPLKGYRQQTTETGELAYDEMGQPVQGEPVYSGDFVFEQVHGFNLLRAPEAKDMKKSPYLIVRKMVDKKKLISQFPDKKQFIQESADTTMIVFDSQKGSYRKSNDEVLLKEYYFRACPMYPNGYYYFATKEGILTEGELPGGIFPIRYQPADKIPTSPRGRSIVKTMRPYQAEINRSASKMAEHQVTLGDDKVLIQNGTKISAGVALPGVRSVNYTGIEPKILPGRDGSQYLAYMQAQIQELYEVMNVAEDSVEKDGQLDPYALLFRAASQKKKFQRYVKRFERFLIDVARTYIQLAKIHLPDDAVIMAVGRSEAINIAEFRNAQDIGYQIKIEPVADDIETKMGKQLSLNHVIQFIGPQLEKQQIGEIVRQMPWANMDKALSDLTADYDAATNSILALDRGEQPLVSQYDNHPYMIQRLTGRVRQPDYRFLPPQIQQMYQQVIQMHEQAEADKQAQIQMMQAGFIPTGGYMVVVDFYVSDPADPNKTRRARIPYESLKWLIDKLEQQGQSQKELEMMNQGAVAQMAQMLNQRQQMMQSQGQPNPEPIQPGAAA